MIEPIGDRVLLELDEPMASTPSGILLPAQAQQKTTEGVVLAVGPGPYGVQGNRPETPIRVGQRVLIPPYSGNEIKDGDKLYQLVRETDIIAIRTPDSEALS